MAEISPQARHMALAELEWIEPELTQMSAWIDGDEPGRVRAAIAAEDAATAIRPTGWLIERPGPAWVAQLAHRWIASNGYGFSG
jgi:hypothetical protein